MKKKTSITLSQEVLAEVDSRLQSYGSRSELIEAALVVFLAQLKRKERDTRDIAILNRRARHLNKEALDVLEYQVDV